MTVRGVDVNLGETPVDATRPGAAQADLRLESLDELPDALARLRSTAEPTTRKDAP